MKKEIIKTYKTSNIFYRYIYSVMSIMINEDESNAVIELFIILNESKYNENNVILFEYKFGKPICDLIKEESENIETGIIRYGYELLKEIIEWEIIFKNYGKDENYITYLKRDFPLYEVDNFHLIDIWSRERNNPVIFIAINDSTRNERLKDLLLKLHNLSPKSFNKSNN